MPLSTFHITTLSVEFFTTTAFDQHTALNKVRETRRGEARLLDKHAPGANGWIGWSLFSGWKSQP
jgi:hypothetical protein